MVGTTIKVEAKLLVASAEILVPDGGNTLLILDLVGLYSNLIVKSVLNNDPFAKGIEEVLAEGDQNDKDFHRFVGFMDNPKDL